jgi:hypothetical protein
MCHKLFLTDDVVGAGVFVGTLVARISTGTTQLRSRNLGVREIFEGRDKDVSIAIGIVTIADNGTRRGGGIAREDRHVGIVVAR